MTGATGSAGDDWAHLPPHLQQSLKTAMDGLSEAFTDLSRPMSPQLQALWDVTDQIEAWFLAMEKLKEEVFIPGE